jgi:hypothetical protein
MMNTTLRAEIRHPVQNRDLSKTLRILIDYAKADPWAENADGVTCVDLAILNRGECYEPVEEWLMQQEPFEFDPDRRDRDGQTLIQVIFLRFDFATASRDIDVLLALGANINARSLSTENFTRIDDKRAPIGVTVLHSAAGRCVGRIDRDENQPLKECQYFIEKGADPHVLTVDGYTATDIILTGIAGYHNARYLHDRHLLAWRRMLIDLGIDIKSFLWNEILAHKHVCWFTDNGCDEYLLALFGYAPRYSRADDSFDYLTLTEELGNAVDETPAHLDFLTLNWTSLFSMHNADSENDEEHFLDDVLTHWYTAPEGEYDPSMDPEYVPLHHPEFAKYQSGDREFEWFRSSFEKVGRHGLARFSTRRFHEQDWLAWNACKDWHWTAYRRLLEQDRLDELSLEDRALWQRFKRWGVGNQRCPPYSRILSE